MPKSTAITYGLCSEELMWFEVLKSKDLRIKNTSAKVCRICVEAAPMSIQDIVAELECLIPGSANLEVVPAGEMVFWVVLPSKSDMARLRKIKDLELESSKIFFEEWSTKQVDKWGLYDLWVRVSGCPDTLCRDYLALFALGSLVGKAKEIDMKFTREHGIVRARIDCASPKAIPRRLDYCYNGEGFAVYFEVETLDGTVILVGEFDMDDGENKGEEDKPNAEKEGKLEDDANIPPSDGAAADDDKCVDMQQEGKDKSSDNIGSLQLGIFSFPLNSPTKSLSVSSTKWYSMVKEEEEEEAKPS
jgi:hypothetical protein